MSILSHAFTSLQPVSEGQSNPEGRSIETQLNKCMQDVADAITACAMVCDTYHKRKLVCECP